ncbi:sulfotransferase [Massilia sp. W12]|uniref:sulfotransferase family protein n=1 Tax=Massilia sp. W12 TaxID=3126507 RepID=UPI0030CB0D34
MTPTSSPFLLRSLNTLGRWLAPHACMPDVRRLQARAQAATGLSDFAPDADFEQGLQMLQHSIRHDARLTLFGRLVWRDLLQRVLENRLLWVAWRKARPEIFQAPPPAPLIVLGHPRSGTTLLHRLLALDPRARALPMWELQRPFPPLRGADGRQRAGRRAIQLLRWAAPDLDHKHLTSGDDAEECMLLLDACLVSLSFWVFGPMHSYMQWWLEADKQQAYRGYAEHLRFLQAQTPDLRLTLKAPAHTGCLPALMQALPQAMIVQTMRDPVTTLTSLNSLLSTLHGVVSDALDLPRMAQTNLQALLQMQQVSQAYQTAHPGSIYQLDYAQLTREPLEAVRAIHRHFDLPFEPDFAARLHQALAQDQHARQSRHHYSPADFGQDAGQLQQAFASGLYAPAAARISVSAAHSASPSTAHANHQNTIIEKDAPS